MNTKNELPKMQEDNCDGLGKILVKSNIAPLCNNKKCCCDVQDDVERRWWCSWQSLELVFSSFSGPGGRRRRGWRRSCLVWVVVRWAILDGSEDGFGGGGSHCMMIKAGKEEMEKRKPLLNA